MKSSVCVLALAALCGSAGAAQVKEAAPPKPDRAAVIGAAKDVMAQAHYCVLVTIGPGGRPQARVLDPFPPEEGMVVWLATNPRTRKVAEIRRDPRVTLCWVDPKGRGYVTLIGKAELVDAPAEKARRWKEQWSSFYKDGSRGPDYLLIRVTPVRLEVVSYPHGVNNDPTTWAPVSIAFP